MTFSEFLSDLGKGKLRPGTEDSLLKDDKDKILKKISEICKDLDKIGNTLTTEFATETLRKTGYACYDFSDELGRVKDLLMRTAFFDLSEKGLTEYLTKKLKGIPGFERIVSVEPDIGGEIVFDFIVEFDKPVDEKQTHKEIKKALSKFEFVTLVTTYLPKDGENRLKFQAVSSNEVPLL